MRRLRSSARPTPASANKLGRPAPRCVKPSASVPDAFYNRRPIARDPELPLGRDDEIAMPSGDSDKDDPVPEGNMTAMDPKTDEPKTDQPKTDEPKTDQPKTEPAGESSASSSSSGCALREQPARSSSNATWIGLSLLAAGAAFTRRRFCS